MSGTPRLSRVTESYSEAEDSERSELERLVWRLVLVVKTRLMDRLDHELQQRSQLSLTDFEILATLAQSPDHRLRMSELAEQALVSRSRLTYRVDRLAALDLVSREECEDDRRGLYAILTDAGAKAYEAAAPDYLAGVRRYFLGGFSSQELSDTAQILSRMDEMLKTL